jgi:hypothetical protein
MSYVYTIADPNGNVFYVGKGSGCGYLGRIRSHLYAARGNHSQQERYRVIRNIWAQGGEPIVTIIPIHDDAQRDPSMIYRLERQFIDFYGGYAHLTNRPGGGEMKHMEKIIRLGA